MKLGIGTAQFGVDYGISNTTGKTQTSEVAAILDLAADNNIHVIDTSPLYGNSETVLGNLLSVGHDFQIVTKTAKFQRSIITDADANALEDTFLRSLERLCQPCVYGLLVHQLDDLLTQNGELLMQRMLSLKQRGLVKKTGLSLSRFSEEQLDLVLERYPIDLIQVPLNVLDQRLLTSGRLRKLRNTGIEVHVRSVFLQGLLLLQPETLPPWFEGIKSHLRRYHDEIAQHGMSPVQAALDFVLGLEEIDVVICGVNNLPQLRELIACAGNACDRHDFGRFAISDEKILNPTNWQLQAA
jgi:aryl-alcohol dehydrogenase-like predicted oxidoreductase